MEKKKKRKGTGSGNFKVQVEVIKGTGTVTGRYEVQVGVVIMIKKIMIPSSQLVIHTQVHARRRRGKTRSEGGLSKLLFQNWCFRSVSHS